MEFDDSFLRRMNDKEYQIELAKYIENICYEENKKFEKMCEKNSFLNNRVKKLYDIKKILSEEEYKKKCAEIIISAFGENMISLTDKVVEFNEKWDKEHYKVIYGKFGGQNGQ